MSIHPSIRLREVLNTPVATQAVSVFDSFSVRSAELLGHEVGMLGGSIAAMALLGAPDIALITSTELADLTRRLTRAAPGFPILVDADHGYGNPMNVFRTIGELEHAGAAGATIEDTLLPAGFDRDALGADFHRRGRCQNNGGLGGQSQS